MIKAETVGAVYIYIYIYISNFIRKTEGKKAFTLGTKNTWAIRNNCSFNMRKNMQAKLCELCT